MTKTEIAPGAKGMSKTKHKGTALGAHNALGEPPATLDNTAPLRNVVDELIRDRYNIGNWTKSVRRPPSTPRKRRRGARARRESKRCPKRIFRRRGTRWCNTRPGRHASGDQSRPTSLDIVLDVEPPVLCDATDLGDSSDRHLPLANTIAPTIMRCNTFRICGCNCRAP